MAGMAGLGVLKTTTNVAAATREHTLVIEGTGDRTDYSFAVGGNLSGEGLTPEDGIDGAYAHGAVAPGRDVYRFDGSLDAFTFDGAPIVVKLDGDWAHVGQRPDYVLTITGTGSYTSYTFDVTDNLHPHYGITGEDNISGTHAEGAVRSGTDTYLFDGDLEAFSFDGEVAVKQNGRWAHVGQLPESIGGDNGDGTSDLRLGYNARERSHNRGNTFENYANGTEEWRATYGTLTTTNDWDGNDGGAVTLISDSSDDRVRMVSDQSSTNFAYRDPSVAVRLRGASNETLHVELRASDGDEELVTSRYLSAKHGWVRVPIAPSAVGGTPDMADITKFTIGCYTGGRTIELDIDDIRTTPKRDSGAVLFTFDDGNETDYTIAFEELRARGWVGTSAVIPRLVGESGKLSRSQMDRMDTAGWTWANHPQAQSVSDGLGSIPGDRAEDMMRDNKRWLLDNGYQRGADTLVWPFGDFDRESLQIAGNYYRLAWGGGSSTANGVVTEAGWVPRIELNEGNDVANALAAIDHAYRTDTVATFMTHGMGGNNIGRADFNRVLDRVAFRNLDVLTTADFADEQ